MDLSQDLEHVDTIPAVRDWSQRPRRQLGPRPKTYWEEYVVTDDWYCKKLVEDVPETELYAALEDENFEEDVGEEGDDESVEEEGSDAGSFVDGSASEIDCDYDPMQSSDDDSEEDDDGHESGTETDASSDTKSGEEDEAV